MKGGLDAIEKKPDTGAVSLKAFSTQRHKQCLDVIPDDAGLHRVMEYGFQRFAVLAGHVILVSLSDNFVNMFVGGKGWLSGLMLSEAEAVEARWLSEAEVTFCSASRAVGRASTW